MIVVIINGSNNSGKDNFVDFFIKHYKYKSINMSTIDRVKHISKKYFGWDGKKNEKSRKFLAEIKKLWADYNNGPFLYMVQNIENHYNLLSKKNKENFVFFIHCREPEEIDKFKKQYDKCITVLLKRNDRTDKNKIADNHADMGVENYDYDLIVNNNGNKIDLELESIKFIEYIKNKK